MNTIALSPPRGKIREHSRNNLLTKAIISLSSGNFCIFVAGIGSLLCWFGACFELYRPAGYGALAVIAALTMRCSRIFARDIRRINKFG